MHPERQGWAGKIKDKIPTKRSLMAFGAAGSIVLVGCSQESRKEIETKIPESTATIRTIENPIESRINPPKSANVIPITTEIPVSEPSTSITPEVIEAVVVETTVQAEQRGEGLKDVYVDGVPLRDLWANYNASLRPQVIPTLLPFSTQLPESDGLVVENNEPVEAIEPTATRPEPESEDYWWDKEAPVKVEISRIGVQSDLLLIDKIPSKDENGNTPQVENIDQYCDQEGNNCTWSTPDYGIATPSEPIVRAGSTTILIYSHSKWLGVEQPFYKLTDLEIGDQIEIENAEGEKSKFTVSEFRLFNYDDTQYKWAENGRDVLLLQATFREKGSFLMNEPVGSSKATVKPEVYGVHMGFHVVAVPIGD